VNTQARVYTGRFAPSPTGPLHAGSLVAALASWLDARAWNDGHGGRWLVRIEDLDTARCVPGTTETILQQLQTCGLHPDEPPEHQTNRTTGYAQALQRLREAGQAYPCACSRRGIENAWARLGIVHDRHAERIYPGTCRAGLQGRRAVAVRYLVPDTAPVIWQDRRLGMQQQDVARAVGDFVLHRADGPYAYQLAVVVDDAAQGVSHVVRGEDLCDNTPRQILLQKALGLPTPQYLHVPLVLAADGHKLSKQNGAAALDLADPLAALQHAAAALGLPRGEGLLADALAHWVRAWRALYNPAL
jgi:glutamyl-Q tRNA(Asp) synthetase